jgi:WD40 repeat protein
MLKGIKEIITLGSNEMMVKNHIWSLEVDRENDLLYAGLHDGLIKVFLMIDNKQKCKGYFVNKKDEFQAHKGIVYTMVLTPCKKKLFSAGLDQQIKLWDLGTKKEIYRLEGHTNVVYTLKLDFEKQILYSGSEDGTVRKWGLKNQKILQVIGGLNSALSSLILHKENTLVSVDSEKREIIRIYNTAKKEFTGRFDGHKDEIFALEMTSDGKKVFSAGNDRFIKIWDFESRRMMKSVLAHSKCINCLLLTDNNKFLFSCSDDCYVKIWTVSENDLVIFVAINHGCQVLTIKLSRDNKLLFSGGKSSKPVKTWDVECLQKPKTLEEVSEMIMRRVGFDKGKEGEEARKMEKLKFREKNANLEKVKSNRPKEYVAPFFAENGAESKKKLQESVIIDEKGKDWRKLQNKFNVVAVESEDPVMIREESEYFFSRKKDEKLRKDLEKLSNEMENLIIEEKTDNRYKEMVVVALGNDILDVIQRQIPAMWKFLVKFMKTEKLKLSEFWQKSVRMLETYLRLKNKRKMKKNEMEIKREKYFMIGKEHFLIVMKALVSNFTGAMRNVNEEIMQYDKKNRKNGKNAKRMKDPVEVVYDMEGEKEKIMYEKKKDYSMIKERGMKKAKRDIVKKIAKDSEKKVKRVMDKVVIQKKPKIGENCVLYGKEREHEDFNSIEEMRIMQVMLREMQSKMQQMSNCLRNDKFRKISNKRTLGFLQKRRRVLEMREYKLQKKCIELTLSKEREGEKLMKMLSEMGEKDKKRGEMEAKICELNGEIKDLREECIRFKKLTDEKANLVEKMQIDSSELTKKQIEELNRELEEIKSKHEKLLEENKELKESKGSENRVETSCFEDFIGFLKKENSSLKENYDSIKRKYEALKEENRNVMFQNKLGQFEKAKVEREKTVLKEKLEQIREKFVKLQNSMGIQNSAEGSNISINEGLNLSMRSNSKNVQNGVIIEEVLGKRDSEEMEKSGEKEEKIQEIELKSNFIEEEKKMENLEIKGKDGKIGENMGENLKEDLNILQIDSSRDQSENKEQIIKMV